MGPRLLIGNPDFRRAFIEASDFVEARRGWSLWKELGNDAPPEGVSAAERNFVQEVVFQLSLFRAFQAANVEFDAVAGISLGDAAAGHAAGAITFEETLQIMCETIRAVLCAGGGDLVAVQAPPSRVAELVSDPAVTMIFDWPVLSVWAVPDAAARRMLRQLRVARIAYARLGFNCLSHTSRVDVAGMLSALSTLPSREPSHLLFSTLEGGVVTGPTPPVRWVRAISEPVRLETMWQTMRDQKYTDIIYIGSVPADQDLFGGLPENERPTSYERAEKLITIPELTDSEIADVSSATLSDVGVALRSSAFARDPYPYYGKWVSEGTVHKLPGENFFVVTGYDAAIHVLKRPESFSSSPFASLSALILGADAPLHTKVRRALSPFFTRERILARRDHVAGIVAHAVE
ncbi:MAG: acyltransferase domain-containing protein, partial [Thermoanaerobaculia bacterium]